MPTGTLARTPLAVLIAADEPTTDALEAFADPARRTTSPPRLKEASNATDPDKSLMSWTPADPKIVPFPPIEPDHPSGAIKRKLVAAAAEAAAVVKS
jgi:hypothetical protein